MSKAVAEREEFGTTELDFQETQAPPTAPPLSPRDELNLLEKETLRRGISNEEFVRIKMMGDCDEQVQTRIAELHKWLAAH